MTSGEPCVMMHGTSTMPLLSADSSATRTLRMLTVALTMDRAPEPSGSMRLLALGVNPPYSIAHMTMYITVSTVKTPAYRAVRCQKAGTLKENGVRLEKYSYRHVIPNTSICSIKGNNKERKLIMF